VGLVDGWLVAGLTKREPCAAVEAIDQVTVDEQLEPRADVEGGRRAQPLQSERASGRGERERVGDPHAIPAEMSNIPVRTGPLRSEVLAVGGGLSSHPIVGNGAASPVSCCHAQSLAASWRILSR